MGYSHVYVECDNNTPIELERHRYGGVFHGTASEINNTAQPTQNPVVPNQAGIHIGLWESNNPIFNGMDGLLRLELLHVSSMQEITLVIGWDVPNLSTDNRVALKFIGERPGATTTDRKMWDDVMEGTSKTASASTPIRKAEVIPAIAGTFDGEFKASAEIKHANNNASNVIVALKLDWVPS